MTSNINSIQISQNVQRWEQASKVSTLDLTIKRVAFAIIFTINLAAIGTALWALIQYTPLTIQTHPVTIKILIFAPFIVGVLAALSQLNFPTGGVNRANYGDYVDPRHMAARIFTYMFFGPTVFFSKRVDWINYRNPLQIEKIRQHLTNNTELKSLKYFRKIDNLVKYGVLNQETGCSFKEFWKKHEATVREIKYYKSEKMTIQKDDLKQRVESTRKAWEELKVQFNDTIPQIPESHMPDMSNTKTRFWFWLCKKLS